MNIRILYYILLAFLLCLAPEKVFMQQHDQRQLSFQGQEDAIHFHNPEGGCCAHNVSSILFTENKGQWGELPLFRTSFHGGYAYFEPGQIRFVLRDMEKLSRLMSLKGMTPEERKKTRVSSEIPHHAYLVRFLGSNKDAHAAPEGEVPDYENYFLGNDPSRWANNVKKFQKIQYQSLYEGINLQYEQQGEHLKYTFLVEPGADPTLIKKQYDHIDGIRLRKGQLIVKTSVEQVVEDKPFAFQVINGDTIEVPCRFVLERKTVSYELPGGYDPDHTLYIDPTLVFSTFTGSVSDNWGYTATYDSEGNAFGGGVVFGSDYPTTTGAYSEDYAGGGTDIVITKFDSLGTSLIYSTFLGGSGVEVPHSLVCNSFDELIMLGTTSSNDFPTTPAAFDTSFTGGMPYTLTSIINYSQGSDIVLARFSADGTALEASTYVGGSSNDGLNTASDLRVNYADEVRGEVMVDEQDNIYVATSTYSHNFPMVGNPFMSVHAGGQKAVVFKMNPSLQEMLWSSYFGGTGDDAAYNLVVTSDTTVYFAGGTNSYDLPVPANAYQNDYQGGVADGYIARISSDGSQLLAATYLGTIEYDQVYFVDHDQDGGIYVLGQTGHTGSQFVQNAPWSQPGGGQFITHLDPDLQSVIFSTAFGNPNNPGPDISPTSFMVDYCNSLYAAGWGGAVNNFGGTSGLAITPNAFQTNTDNSDYYFIVLDEGAADLQYATFFGGSLGTGEHVDGGTSRFSKQGVIYQAICAGCGGVSDLPTTANAWSVTNNSNNCNLAVVKFDFDVKSVVADFKRPLSGCVPYTINFQNRSFSSGNQTSYFWDFGDGNTSTDENPVYTYTQKGLYHVKLIVTDSTTCNIADSAQYVVMVLGNEVEVLPETTVCYGDSVELGIAPFNAPGVTYSWSPVVYQTGTPPVTFMPPYQASRSKATVLPRNDTVFYLAIDNQVCIDTNVYPVRVIDLTADAGPDQLLCDSTAILNGSGSGAPGLHYIWSEDPTFSDTINSDLSTGVLNYTLTSGSIDLYLMVTDGQCTAYDTVNLSPLVQLTDSLEPPACHGDCNGYISVSPAGGNPPYTYIWNTGDTSPSISGLCAGNYSVTVYDNDSCVAVHQFLLQDPPPITCDLDIYNAPCEDVCIGEISANPAGGTPPYSYSWSDGQTGNPAVQLCVGSYTVTVTDHKGCEVTESGYVEDASYYINFTAHAEDDTIYQGQSTRIFTQDSAGYHYSWSPQGSLEHPTNPSTRASPEQTTTYVVTITDEHGCVWSDTVTVVVRDVYCDDPYIFVPNAFTPDGDGINDVLYVRTQFADELYFAVYNRWGEKVFETENKQEGWDGTIKGEKAKMGVYVYYLWVRCYTGDIFERKGNVTLIR